MINLCNLLISLILFNYFTDNLGYSVSVGKPGYSNYSLSKSGRSLGICLLFANFNGFDLTVKENSICNFFLAFLKSKEMIVFKDPFI